MVEPVEAVEHPPLVSCGGRVTARSSPLSPPETGWWVVGEAGQESREAGLLMLLQGTGLLLELEPGLLQAAHSTQQQVMVIV
ncbi:unnamed protein product [Pleuronectes platessa]|uniref:Uncharacterized protein n=1 Tax=Pleuronectes platessa TaxID=8262 RepID=A0A9N7V9Z7_PLEPL|nr:unnamed protein product [Pleuronectes platessa]